MGDRVEKVEFTPGVRSRYRKKVKKCLAVLEQLLREERFEIHRKLMGLEIELNLADDQGRPCMMNEQVLERIASRDFQTELGQFNIEVNIAPHKLVASVFGELAEEMSTSINYADRMAGELGVRVIMIGILPTLMDTHMGVENFSRNPRYALLNDQIINSRGEDIELAIDGPERLRTSCSSILPESACTSVQLHLQVDPDEFAAYWNAAQAVAGTQIALGANSPFLFGRELWRETRTVLFEQATDTRPEELVAQGVRPRVWFGERWIDSVLDLFHENVRYFPALLPLCDDEDPEQVLAGGGVPHLRELRLHNGTIYRWNRPVYDVARGKPHLRVENRVLPAGPTVVDTVANAAFYYGLVRALVETERPVWTRMEFEAATANFHAAAIAGIDAELYWPSLGTQPATDLVLRELLPLAYQGLDLLRVEPAERDRYLSVIEQRCLRRTNGASWQSAAFRRLLERGTSRSVALEQLTVRYAELTRSGAPVHEWPVD